MDPTVSQSSPILPSVLGATQMPQFIIVMLSSFSSPIMRRGERRPIAQANTALSVSNWNEAVKVPSALGLNPKAADLLNTIATTSCGLRGESAAGASAAASSWLPPILSVPMAKAMLEGSLNVGRTLSGNMWGPLKPVVQARVKKIFDSGNMWGGLKPVVQARVKKIFDSGNTWGELKPVVQARVKKIFDSGETLRLQFPREDLGFTYTSGALHPRQQIPASTNTSDESKRIDKSDRNTMYTPSSAPGCRLPHCWLLDLHPSNQASKQLSTLDLVASSGSSLILITDWADGDANVWARAGVVVSRGVEGGGGAAGVSDASDDSERHSDSMGRHVDAILMSQRCAQSRHRPY
eukprot:gene22737-29902_t